MRSSRRPWRPLLVIVFVSLLGCKQVDMGPSQTRDLPPTFRTLDILAIDDATALLGGVEEPRGPDAVDAFRAAIVRSDAAGVRKVLDTDGTGVLGLCRGGTRLFALLKRPPTPDDMGESRLLISDDGGGSWRDRGRIPIKAGLAIAAPGADEIFVLGITELVRSGDSGASWSQVRVPGNHLMDARIAVVNHQLAILGSGVDATGDGGRTWHHTDLGASRVHAVDSWGVLATVDGKLKLGRMQAGGAGWIATFKDPIEPYRLVIDDPHIRFLATERGGAVILFESTDGGASWKRAALPSLPEEDAATLGPHGWCAVDARHRLLTAR